jgi:hypothetical protein
VDLSTYYGRDTQSVTLNSSDIDEIDLPVLLDMLPQYVPSMAEAWQLKYIKRGESAILPLVSLLYSIPRRNLAFRNSLWK